MSKYDWESRWTQAYKYSRSLNQNILKTSGSWEHLQQVFVQMQQEMKHFFPDIGTKKNGQQMRHFPS